MYQVRISNRKDVTLALHTFESCKEALTLIFKIRAEGNKARIAFKYILKGTV
jgi:hypothetical protein